MKYHHALNQAKNLLDSGAYNLCAIQCGRILEALLKALLNELYTQSTKYKLDVKTKSLLNNCFVRTTKKTLGNLIYLVDKSNAIELISGPHDLKRKEIESVNFDVMLSIRNKASHDGNDDSVHSAGADAYIIYGYLLKFWGMVQDIPIFAPKLKLPNREPGNIEIKNKIKTHTEKIPEDREKSLKQFPKKKTVDKPKDVIETTFVEICRNKKSGEKFVFIEERLDGNASFILPNGKVKYLPLTLFFELEEAEIEDLTEMQLKSLKIIREHEKTNHRKVYFRDAKEKEPTYIPKYRKMLENPDTIPSIMLDIVKSNSPVTWKRIKNKLINGYGYRETGSFGASLRVLKIDGYVKIQGHGDDKIISFLKDFP